MTGRPSADSVASRAVSTPERTAFVRFRRALVTHDLDAVLFDAVTAQLKATAVIVKVGTLVDATIIASASEDDAVGRWVKHKGKVAVRGFKAHVGADATTALVEKIAITPTNINDGRAGPDALRDDPGEVFADSAYRGNLVRHRRASPVPCFAWIDRRCANSRAEISATNRCGQSLPNFVMRIY